MSPNSSDRSAQAEDHRMKNTPQTIPQHMLVENIDWPNWQAEQICTLLFVHKAGRVLMIRKKRGLGAGLINGPGGRLEPGETPLECAIRETQEELCITAKEVKPVAELFFHAEDEMPTIHGYVYVATDFEGEPTETDEAIPIWFDVEDIPYDEMWQDDKYWLPRVLNGEYLHGWFSFEGEALLDYKIETRANAQN